MWDLCLHSFLHPSIQRSFIRPWILLGQSWGTAPLQPGLVHEHFLGFKPSVPRFRCSWAGWGFLPKEADGPPVPSLRWCFSFLTSLIFSDMKWAVVRIKWDPRLNGLAGKMLDPQALQMSIHQVSPSQKGVAQGWASRVAAVPGAPEHLDSVHLQEGGLSTPPGPPRPSQELANRKSDLQTHEYHFAKFLIQTWLCLQSGYFQFSVISRSKWHVLFFPWPIFELVRASLPVLRSWVDLMYPAGVEV